MIALTHDNARDWLNVGSAELNAAERDALTTHLDQCAECQVYAAELSELHTALTRLFRTRWQSMPSQQAMDAAVTRLKQRQTRQRATRRINTLAFAAGLVALALAFVWVLDRPAVPAGPQTAAASLVPSTVQVPVSPAAPRPDSPITLIETRGAEERLWPGSSFTLTFRWRANTPMTESYLASEGILDQQGRVVQTSITVPGGRDTTTWAAGEIIEDEHTVSLPDTIEPGQYQIVVSLYDMQTGEPLKAFDGQDSARVMTITVQAMQQRFNQDFGSFARLLGVDGITATVSTGEAMPLTLYWQALAATDSSYQVSLQVFDANKRLVAQTDGLPGNGARPTNTWQPGEIIVDSHTLQMLSHLSPGEYRLLLLLFDTANGAQVFTSADNGAITLATFKMQAKAEVTSSQPIDLSACPVTLPNGNTPPGEVSSPEHHGNGALFTVLWPEGNILMGPHNVESDGSLSMKFVWWRGVKGALTIEGRRLDADAPPLRAVIPDGYGDSGVQASALIFPTEGCWEVTGRVGDAALTFVTRVTKADQ